MTVKYSLNLAGHFLLDFFCGEVLAATLAPDVFVGEAYPFGVPCLPLVAVADELWVGLFVD